MKGWYLPIFWTGKVLGTIYFRHWDKLWMGQWVKNLDLESKICFCLWHVSGGSSWIFMIAVICHKVVIVHKPMSRETGLAKCLKVLFFSLFSLIHVVVVSCCCSTGCYSETKRQFLEMVGFLMLRLPTCLQSNLSYTPGGPVSSKDD